MCICPDIDKRLENLRNSQILAIDVDRIQEERLLNKFDIEREREKAKAEDE